MIIENYIYVYMIINNKLGFLLIKIFLFFRIF